MTKSIFSGAAKWAAIDILKPAQGHCCAYCREPVKYKDFTLDHVMPLRVGGADDFENLLAVCEPCNNKKGGELPIVEFHEAIRRAIHSQIREAESSLTILERRATA